MRLHAHGNKRERGRERGRAGVWIQGGARRATSLLPPAVMPGPDQTATRGTGKQSRMDNSDMIDGEWLFMAALYTGEIESAEPSELAA